MQVSKSLLHSPPSSGSWQSVQTGWVRIELPIFREDFLFQPRPRRIDPGAVDLGMEGSPSRNRVESPSLTRSIRL